MSHYFDPVPHSPSARRVVPLVLADVTVELATDRGVFSASRIDPGTKLLLSDAPRPPRRGVLVDLGCGYGPIAVALALRSPDATVWAVDVNARALELTMANASAAGAGNVTVADPGDVPPHLTFDALYSNPPIRIGSAALHALLQEWIPRARVSHLVVQKNLGSDSLARWMVAQGWSVERLMSRIGYRLLRVVPS
ncbi:MAG: class I SAM-dependent methyltransferase [Acidimicrobiales bacterium]